MSNTISLEEFLQNLQESGKDGTSAYNLRNENEQFKNRTSSIKRFKKEKKKKAKLCVVMELAIPFDPLTGKETEQYNPDKKFRPQKTATTVALMIKAAANNNEELKNVYMKKAGIESWDTSDIDTLTDVDKQIFRKYRVPSVYTFPVVSINIPTMTGEYARDYVISVTRDPITNAVVGEKPLVLQAYDFFRDICFEEIQELADQYEKKLIDCTEKQYKEKRGDIWRKNPIQEDHPNNYILAVELPLNSTYDVDINLGSFDDAELKSHLVYTKRGKDLNDSLSKYLTGEWVKYDTNFDFVEIDVACPNDGETPMEIGKNTKYEKPTSNLNEFASADSFNAAFSAYFNDNDKLEEIVINSVRIAKYDESVESQLCSTLSSVVDTKNQYLTKKVIKAHRNFITLALGDMGDELLLDVEMGAEDRKEGVLDVDQAVQQAKEISIDELLSESSVTELEDMQVS